MIQNPKNYTKITTLLLYLYDVIIILKLITYKMGKYPFFDTVLG